jgi:hypothetical protein
MRRSIAALLVGVVVVAACGNSVAERRAAAEGATGYRAKASGERGAPKVVTVAVRNEGAGLAEVREAVRHEAVRYCLTERGLSEHEFETDPATGDWAFTQAGDTLVFRAACRW